MITKLLTRKEKAWEKSSQAANDLTKFNRRAELDFYHTINNTMNNYSISAKKKFSVLVRGGGFGYFVECRFGQNIACRL